MNNKEVLVLIPWHTRRIVVYTDGTFMLGYEDGDTRNEHYCWYLQNRGGCSDWVYYSVDTNSERGSLREEIGNAILKALAEKILMGEE